MNFFFHNDGFVLISHVRAVGCLNNDRTVMSKPFAWRPLGLLPILKPGPCTNNNVAWQRYRRLDLYHRCMDKVIAEINELCSEDRHFRFADGKVREGRCFWHLLSMDGLEISYTAMCPTDECPVCECPKDELDRTDKYYDLRHGSKIKSMVQAAQAELLNPDGSVKHRCKTKVFIIFHTCYQYYVTVTC
jgi:hypothetical protein